MEKEKIIEVKDLIFGYEKDSTILKCISFDIFKGEYVTLIGHNGSGKSTLAKLLSYILEPTSGKVYIEGQELNEKSIKDIRSKIGIVFQNPDNQFIGSTVEDDIAFGLENRNIKQDIMKKTVLEFAKKVGMDKFLNKEPEELSGGQKQRVAIAGILALNLKIIIFDEATSMLDPEGVEEIRKLILNMKEENPELTVISITHDIEEAYLSDRVIILNDGKVYKNDIPENVFKDEEEMRKIDLDIPFVLKIKNKLAARNIIIPREIKTIEGVANYLCQ